MNNNMILDEEELENKRNSYQGWDLGDDDAITMGY